MFGFFKAVLARGLGLASALATLGSLAVFFPVAAGFLKVVGLPLLVGVMITALDTLLILWFQGFGIRSIEAFVLALITVAAAISTSSTAATRTKPSPSTS